MTKTYCDYCGKEFDPKAGDHAVWEYWNNLKPGDYGVEIHRAISVDDATIAPVMDLCNRCYARLHEALTKALEQAPAS